LFPCILRDPWFDFESLNPGYHYETGDVSVDENFGVVHLHGLVTSSDWATQTVIAKIPPLIPRPAVRGIYCAMANPYIPARIDVLDDGSITCLSAGSSWISLDGLFYHDETAYAFNDIPLSGTWQNFAGCPDCSGAQYKKVGDMVFLRGLVSTASQWSTQPVILTLPADSQPPQDLIFTTVANSNEGVRVDVTKNGEVRWMEGGAGTSWLSLDSIFFSTSDSGWQAVTFWPGWDNYGPLQQSVQARRTGDYVYLRGLAKTTASWASQTVMFNLPTTSIPPKRQLMLASANGTPAGRLVARVDVVPANGTVEYLNVPSLQTALFVSLDGLSFRVV